MELEISIRNENDTVQIIPQCYNCIPVKHSVEGPRVCSNENTADIHSKVNIVSSLLPDSNTFKFLLELESFDEKTISLLMSLLTGETLPQEKD